MSTVPRGIQELAAAVSARPDSPAALNNLGLHFRGQGRTGLGLQLFHRAIELRPTYARAYSNSGNALRGFGELQLAELHLRTATQLMPTLPPAFTSLVSVLCDIGQAEEAIGIAEAAVQLRPQHGDSYDTLGRAMEQAGLQPNAIRAFQSAAQTSPGEATALFTLGTALAKGNRAVEASHAFDLALLLRPNSLAGDLAFAGMRAAQLMGAGRHAESVGLHYAVVSRSLRLPQHELAYAYVSLGIALQHAGMQGRSMLAYEQAFELLPTDQAPLHNLNKLPASKHYQAGVAREARVLAHRSAAVALATLGQLRRNAQTTFKARDAHGVSMSEQLRAVIAHLRQLERGDDEGNDLARAGAISPTKPAGLWTAHAAEFNNVLSRLALSGTPITLTAFAWGAVWLQSFASAFTHHATREVLAQPGSRAVVFGSPIARFQWSRPPHGWLQWAH